MKRTYITLAPIRICDLDDCGDRYKVDPHDVTFGRHPLLEACVKSMDVPKGLAPSRARSSGFWIASVERRAC